MSSANFFSKFGDIHAFYKSLPGEYLMIGHCFFAATLAPDFKDRFLVHYWLTFLSGFGGGTLSAVLLMNPSKAPIAIFATNFIGIVWTLAWWLSNYSPGNIVYKIYKIRPIEIACKLSTQILRVATMVARVDAAVSMYPGVIAAPLILGTIGGSGGKFISDFIRHGWNSLDTFSEASVPTQSFRSSVMGAAIYYFGHHYFGVLTAAEGAGLVTTLIVGHTLAADLMGMPLDWTYPPFYILHLVSNIPMPKADIKALPPKAPKALAAKAPAVAPATSASSKGEGEQKKSK